MLPFESYSSLLLFRFAQFFISPLFTESATDRERNAVHSEHMKNVQVHSAHIKFTFRAINIFFNSLYNVSSKISHPIILHTHTHTRNHKQHREFSHTRENENPAISASYTNGFNASSHIWTYIDVLTTSLGDPDGKGVLSKR